MSQKSVTEEFSFEWRIENFSMCALNQAEQLNSPMFVIDFLENTKWYLILFPKGDKDNNWISCALYRVAGDSTEIKVGFSLSLVNASAALTKEIESYSFKNCSSYGFCRFANLMEIYSNRDVLLPNDVLTVRCRMWADRETIENCEIFNRPWFSARTRIEVEDTSFTWTMEHFSSSLTDKTWISPPILARNDAAGLFMTCSASANSDHVQILIRRKQGKRPISVRCKITVLCTREDLVFSQEGYYLLESAGNFWHFPDFINVNELYEAMDLYLTNDSLCLHCEVAISTAKDIWHGEVKSCRELSTLSDELHNANDLEKTLLQFYTDQKYCDVVLRTSGQTHPAHRLILCIRSPVFAAILRRAPNAVDIPDVDSKTMDKLLEFIYLGRLEDLHHDLIWSLYSAAARYMIPSLKKLCLSFLTSAISVENVCKILTIAHRCQEYKLQKSAQDFIEIHRDSVLNSQEWRDFMKRHSMMACEIMYQMLTNKPKLSSNCSERSLGTRCIELTDHSINK